MLDSEFTDLQQRVLDRIDEQNWLDLTTEMVRTGQPRSCNPIDPDIPAGEEEAIAVYVAGKLEKMGFEVTMHESQRHRPNVLGILKGTEGGVSLMMNDHLDTYPAVEPEKWDMCGGDPFAATRHGDWLYARGTSDTRANLAASLVAVKAVVDEGVKLKGDLICCYTVDEEKDGVHGSIFMSQTVGLKADYSITAEPTAWGWDDQEWGMNISAANSGHCLITLSLTGVKSHLWRPDTGVNAVTVAAELIPKLNELEFTHEITELMGNTPPCLSVLRIRGGIPGEMQFTPDDCALTLGVVGIVPGMTLETIMGDIGEVVSGHLGGRNDVSFSIEQVPGSLFVEPTAPVGAEEEPCVSIRRNYGKIIGGEPNINRKNAFNDTIRWREAGMNAVTFGPGEDGWAPVNESISIKKSLAATKIYALTIMDILGVAE